MSFPGWSFAAPAGERLLAGGGSLPPSSPSRLLTDWSFDPVVVLVLLSAAAAYLVGVRRLRRRGVHWGTGRSVLWLLGLLVIFVATSSAVAVYDGTLFTMHAVQHLLLQTLAPIPLALAAPITLALRALPLGGRRRLLGVLRSRPAGLLTQPLVAYGIFVVSPFVLYYSPLYEATLRNDWLHNLAHVHFVAVGFLLFAVLLGLDPLPHPMPYVFRVMMVIGLGPMHVLLGIPVMMGNQIFARGYYEQLGRTWGDSLLADQQLGGGLLWVFGDVVTIAFLAGLFGQWLKSDAREARRVDRNLDRLYGNGPTMPAPWTVDQSPATAGPSLPEPRDGRR